MTEDEYAALTQACDRLLRAPDTSLGRICIPLLHVINEHTGWLAQYEPLFRRGAASLDWRSRCEFLDIPRVALRAARALRRSVSSGGQDFSRFRGTDVLLVSHLGNPAHLDWADDFYFGSLQQLLQERGVRVTLALIDHRPPGSRPLEIPGRLARTRILLPRTLAPSVEADIWYYCGAVRRQLRRSAQELGNDSLEGRLAKLASRHALSAGTAENLRLHAVLSALCRSLEPRIVITTYEGDACERIVFHAARCANRRPVCVGYQHTTLLARAHAIRRSVAAAGIDCDPDVVLTSGDASHSLFERSPGLKGVHLIQYGSHRRIEPALLSATDERAQLCLVLPDADDRECAFLFEFALACARRLPQMQFVLRPHPAISLDSLRGRYAVLRDLPPNVTLSVGNALPFDMARARYCLYRGSSAVIHAVLAGIKPFYVARPGELSLDPLFALQGWRESVSSAEEFVGLLSAAKVSAESAETARRQCNTMVSPVRPAALDELLSRGHSSLPGTCSCSAA